LKDGKLFWNVDENLAGLKLSHAILNEAGESVVLQGKKLTPRRDARTGQAEDRAGRGCIE